MLLLILLLPIAAAGLLAHPGCLYDHYKMVEAGLYGGRATAARRPTASAATRPAQA
jgi:hypothetical protein